MPVTSLTHNGVLIIPYEPKGFVIRYRGESLRLNPDQEEMAVAFAKQLGARVGDPVFVRNFLKDFAKALKIDGRVRLEDFDFSEILSWLEAERATKESMAPEERKALATRGKQTRELNRERYGYAWVNGERVEIANYAVEPPCIFIGRGRHPLRGRWKPRVRYDDVVLNLSPDAPEPDLLGGGRWGGRVFDPKGLWVARWRDTLTGKLKYVWIADTAPVKQEREVEKFNLARKLRERIGKVRQCVEDGLNSEDPDERRIATVASLIDGLKLRVGDEKDSDELDTIGATTLKKTNVKIRGPDEVEFTLLGKGAVRFHMTINLPPQAVENVKTFLFDSPGRRIFPDLRSEHVNRFFDQAMRGLTAKVFRTYHATETVRRTLKKFGVYPKSPGFRKLYVAKRANLEAARILNHRKKPPRDWAERIEKQISRVKFLGAKLEEIGKSPPTRARERLAENTRKKLWAAKLKLKLARRTKNYNLGTSLRSYIDPRVYVQWADGVSYDWRNVYPKSLQRKFAWAEARS